MVMNESGQEAKTLWLEHEGGKEEFGPIAKNDSKSVAFESAGENSYTITAVLENGDTLRSKGTYTEGGYKLIEVMSATEIKTKFEKY